ncbi:hypothetical protein GJ496_004528 [Pomphorhynchus laevis]|nr:hypothetical protein GJ496_004528 [Pomphorhynchus laevis]
MNHYRDVISEYRKIKLQKQEDLLNLGLNYNILDRDFSRYDVANSIKHTTLKAFKDIDDKQVRHLSINTLGKLTFDKYMNLHPNHEYIPNINNGERNALKELKRSIELIIKKLTKVMKPYCGEGRISDEAYRQLNSPAYEPSSEIEFKSINSKIDNLIDTFLSMKFISICEAIKLRNTT